LDEYIASIFGVEGYSQALFVASLAYSFSDLEHGAMDPSKTPQASYQNTWLYIPEDSHNHCCENFKFNM
jgi:hypothetical protein